MKKPVIVMAGVFALTLWQVGCSAPHRISRPAKLHIVSSPRLNLDENGYAHPVEVRIYFLRSHHAFASRKSLELWENDDAILTRDLIWKNQITVFPARDNTMILPRPELAQAGYLGIVANYIKPRLNQNKDVFALHQGQSFTLKLEPRHLSLEVNSN